MLEEAKLPFDLRVVSLESKQQRAPEYLEMNPSGRVPVIRDGQFTLAESNAILRYLVRRYKLDNFYPPGLSEQATLDMWWEFCSAHINKPLLDLAWNRIMVKKYGGQVDHGAIAKAEKGLARDLPVLEHHLMGRRFLAGPNLTLADINLMPFAVYAADVLALRDFPYFEAWIKRVGDMSAWATVARYSGR